MAETSADAPTAEQPAVQPRHVEYDPVTGVPSEFNEFLPKDSEEFKRWKAAREAAAAGGVEQLSLGGGGGDGAAPAAPPPVVEKKMPGGKIKKLVPQVVLERNTRNKKKCITTIAGLDTFGVKLTDASKLFGKKFASGASIVKTAEGKEQIDVQGDFLDQAAELVIKQYKVVRKADVYFIDGKKKVPYFDESEVVAAE